MSARLGRLATTKSAVFHARSALESNGNENAGLGLPRQVRCAQFPPLRRSYDLRIWMETESRRSRDQLRRVPIRPRRRRARSVSPDENTIRPPGASPSVVQPRSAAVLAGRIERSEKNPLPTRQRTTLPVLAMIERLVRGSVSTRLGANAMPRAHARSARSARSTIWPAATLSRVGMVREIRRHRRQR
jgi:hypothetical protein